MAATAQNLLKPFQYWHRGVDSMRTRDPCHRCAFDQRILDISPTRWRDEICRALTAASAALLLVSQDFLASDFIAKDVLPLLLQKAEKDGLKIFWIPVKPSTFMHSPVAAFQAAVDDPTISMPTLRRAKREEQYVRICEKLAKAMAS